MPTNWRPRRSQKARAKGLPPQRQPFSNSETSAPATGRDLADARIAGPRSHQGFNGCAFGEDLLLLPFLLLRLLLLSRLRLPSRLLCWRQRRCHWLPWLLLLLLHRCWQATGSRTFVVVCVCMAAYVAQEDLNEHEEDEIQK